MNMVDPRQQRLNSGSCMCDDLQCDGRLPHRCVGQEVSGDGFDPQEHYDHRRQESYMQTHPIGSNGDVR